MPIEIMAAPIHCCLDTFSFNNTVEIKRTETIEIEAAIYTTSKGKYLNAK